MMRINIYAMKNLQISNMKNIMKITFILCEINFYENMLSCRLVFQNRQYF